MAGTYHWVVLLVFFFPLGTLASFIVDDFTKPALTCTPFLIQWQGGISPWTLRVLEASNPNVLENLGTLKVTSFNWNVDLAAGTSVQIQLQDSSGAIALSQTLTIQAGSTDCTLSTAEIQQPTTQQTTTQQSTIQQSTTKLSVTQLTATKQATSSSAIASTSSTAVPQTFSLTRSFISSAYTTLSTTESRSVAPEQSPSPSLVVFPASTSFLSSSSSAAAGGGSASQSVGAFSTTSPEALGTLKGSTPTTGVILGILFPGLMLMVFFCVFIFRRRRRSTPDVEQLSSAETQNTPKWFLRPAYHSETARFSYGIQSSGSYRTATRENRPSPSVAPSDSNHVSYPAFFA